MTHLTEKRNKTIKAQTVHIGKPTREWLSREESASPTALIEDTFLTAMIDAWEKRDVMTADMPNTFTQAKLNRKEGESRVIMKITGVLVELSIKKAPHTHEGFIALEHGKKVMCLNALAAIYGISESASLWHRKLREDLEQQGFKFNACNACVANRIVEGKQHVVRFHVDNLMSSHEDSKVNNEFYKWLNKKCGKHDKVKATRGPDHDYLGMTFRF